MSDEIDDEVEKLLREVELELEAPGVLEEVEGARLFAEMLKDPDNSVDIMLRAISLLAKNFDKLKDHPRYQEKVEGLATPNMLLTPGFQLAEKLEEYKLGHRLAVIDRFNLARRLFELPSWLAE
jgi:hypothetical protein